MDGEEDEEGVDVERPGPAARDRPEDEAAEDGEDPAAGCIGACRIVCLVNTPTPLLKS